MLIPWLYMLSYNLETPKEIAFLTRDYHNQNYITTTVNNYLQLFFFFFFFSMIIYANAMDT